MAQPQSPIDVIAEAPTAEAAARTLINGAAMAFTRTDTPAGCLLASSAIAVSAEAEDVKEELAAIRREIEAALRDKIAAGIDAGDVPGTADPTALAAFVITAIQGLSTLARDCGSRAKLQQVAKLAMLVWPSPRSHA